MQEVKGFLGDTSANTSRIIKTLAKFTAKRTNGLNVIETCESPIDGRHKLCKLTPKGKKLYQDLKLSMN
jgi:DNA-binding MarR family transcriptional regulator